MGCSQNRDIVIQGLKEDIQRLQVQKSKLLKDLDVAKESASIYELSEDDILILSRKLASEHSSLESEYTRLTTLSTQIENLTTSIADLDTSISSCESTQLSLTNSLAIKNQQYLQQSEELTTLLQSHSELTLASKHTSKRIQSLTITSKENELLDERIKTLTEKIQAINEAEEITNTNSMQIFALEGKIKQVKPMIDEQNLKHQFLVAIDEEIKKIKEEASGWGITEAQRKYREEVYRQVDGIKAKNEIIDRRIQEIQEFNIEEAKDTKDSYLLIRSTLKQEIQDMSSEENKQIIEMMKMEGKKAKISGKYERASVGLERIYERVCNKLQKKQAVKANLEAQLKEFQDIAADIDM